MESLIQKATGIPSYNEYCYNLKKHLANYKETVLNIKGNGIWKNNGKEYPHILPESQYSKNLIDAGFQVKLCQLTKSKHCDFHHLNSSQALAINLFGPMKIKNDYSLIFNQNDSIPNIKEGATSEFEHKETDGTKFDFYINNTGQNIYFEVKYSESHLATKSKAKANSKRWKAYYEKPMNAIIKEPSKSKEYFFQQYQLWRNIIRVANNDDLSVFVIPAIRADFKKAIDEAIEKIRPEYQSRIKTILIDDICDRCEKDNRFRTHYSELRRKYIFQFS